MRKGEANVKPVAPDNETANEGILPLRGSDPIKSAKLQVQSLHAGFPDQDVLNGISLDIESNAITAVIGPSGCGKSTFIRCLNRMHELEAGATMRGKVLLNGEDIYDPRVDPTLLRRRVGMIFPKANPFPTLSIRDNVLSGLRLTRRFKRAEAASIVEESLFRVNLWQETKDQLDGPVHVLSAGQKQQLCIARALALAPEVLLMDEPCAVLDPIATAKIEDLLSELRDSCAIVIVTHNMQQALRVSDRCAFFLAGDLIEYAKTDDLFTDPKNRQTEDYITGKFG